jgi:hypothetical protein
MQRNTDSRKQIINPNFEFWAPKVTSEIDGMSSALTRVLEVLQQAKLDQLCLALSRLNEYCSHH